MKRKELEEQRLDRAAAMLGKSIAWEIAKDLVEQREVEAVLAAERSALVARPAPLAIQSLSDHVPLPRGQAQDAAILDAIKKLNLDPLALPKRNPGKRTVKADIREDLTQHCKKIFQSERIFNTAWQRLRDEENIVDPTA